MLSSPSFVNLTCAEVGLVLVPQIGFVLLGCLSFHQPPGLCLSCLSFSLFPLPSTLFDSCANASEEFLCMDTLSCLRSVPMKLVVGLLHGSTFLSNLPLVLLVFLNDSSLTGRLLNSKYDQLFLM